MARPTKLTPDVEERILLGLRAGNFLKVAAAAAGVGEATLHRWLADRRPPYRAFDAAVRKAIAESEVLLVGRIAQVAPQSPGVALRLLERRYPQRWGRARADLVQPPDEFPADPPTPGKPKPPTLQDQVVGLSPEWQLPIFKLLAAAAVGRTPAEFFERPDTLASLRDEYPPRDPWWKMSGEPLTPTPPAGPLDARHATAETVPATDALDGPEEDPVGIGNPDSIRRRRRSTRG